MIDKNKNFLDPDLIRQSIHELCDRISLYSPEVLKFIFQKSGIVSWNELVKNYPQILRFSGLAYSVNDLYYLVVEGRSCFAPKIFQNDEEVNEVVRSIAIPIFIEEAQMILQGQECTASNNNNNSSNLQHNQQAPSLEQSQHTFGDDTHDSDNDLSDL